MVNFTSLAIATLAQISMTAAAPTVTARDSHQLFSYNIVNFNDQAVTQTCASTAVIEKDFNQAFTSTILSFWFDSSFAGKTCKFNFAVPVNQAHTNGNGIQIFRVNPPTTACSVAGGVLNASSGRDRQVADIKDINSAARNIVSPGTDDAHPGFPCPSNTHIRWELVGTGDDFHVTFGHGQNLSVSAM